MNPTPLHKPLRVQCRSQWVHPDNTASCVTIIRGAAEKQPCGKMGKLTFNQKIRKILCERTSFLCCFFLSSHSASLWLYRQSWHLEDVNLKFVTQCKRSVYVFDFKQCPNNGTKIMRVKYSCRQGSALFQSLLFIDEFKTSDFSPCRCLFLFSINQCFVLKAIELRISNMLGSHLVTISPFFLTSFERFRFL